MVRAQPRRLSAALGRVGSQELDIAPREGRPVAAMCSEALLSGHRLGQMMIHFIRSRFDYSFRTRSLFFND
jgi:hypothetical protein